MHAIMVTKSAIPKAVAMYGTSDAFARVRPDGSMGLSTGTLCDHTPLHMHAHPLL